MHKIINTDTYICRRFGRLTVVGFHKVVEKEYNGKLRRDYIFDCECDCGNHKFVSLRNLKRGCTKSCGCLRRYVNIYNIAHARSFINKKGEKNEKDKK